MLISSVTEYMFIYIYILTYWAGDKAEVILGNQPSVKPGKRDKIPDATNDNQHRSDEQPPPNLTLEERLGSVIDDWTQTHEVKKPILEHTWPELRIFKVLVVAALQTDNRFDIRMLWGYTVDGHALRTESASWVDKESLGWVVNRRRSGDRDKPCSAQFHGVYPRD